MAEIRCGSTSERGIAFAIAAFVEKKNRPTIVRSTRAISPSLFFAQEVHCKSTELTRGQGNFAQRTVRPRIFAPFSPSCSAGVGRRATKQHRPPSVEQASILATASALFFLLYLSRRGKHGTADTLQKQALAFTQSTHTHTHSQHHLQQTAITATR
jgi:hypothetical protein